MKNFNSMVVLGTRLVETKRGLNHARLRPSEAPWSVTRPNQPNLLCVLIMHVRQDKMLAWRARFGCSGLRYGGLLACLGPGSGLVGRTILFEPAGW